MLHKQHILIILYWEFAVKGKICNIGKPVYNGIMKKYHYRQVVDKIRPFCWFKMQSEILIVCRCKYELTFYKKLFLTINH